MRIKKLNTPIFMTTTTKFGLSLLNSCPKKCPFRYDLVWVKSAPAGFLSAKKMPMRKHEMIYVFYEKLPFYDLSSHTHKFIKKYQEEDMEKSLYGKMPKTGKDKESHSKQYDPPLPVSIVKEETGGATGMKKDFTPNKNGNIYDCPDNQEFEGRNGKPRYDPPLPVSMLEIKSTKGKHSTEKPVALMSWILKYYSKEGDVILDPTMGSGSTGVACKEMNRNFIGMEMDDEIYEVAVNRIEN
jgi:site-specific DNA-methyltransferase (adenine-specific)